MSFFYFSPPNGHIFHHLLENIIDERITYLSTSLTGMSPEFSEYLIDGSIYDKVGHFMLLAVSILCQNKTFTNMVYRGEVLLFKKRLSALSSNEMRYFAKKILKEVKKSDESPLYIDAVYKICRKLILKPVSHHVCSTDHNFYCKLHTTPANFKACLPWVAQRLVDLKNGMANLPCGLWMQYLVHAYKMHLKGRINSNTNICILKNDPRVMDIVLKVTKKSQNNILNNNIQLLSSNIDFNSQFFPPCMRHLHNTLRVRHRLSHHQRFYYSLFLKDIGLPINEAVTFWKEEYTKNPKDTHICTHHWLKDEKKFVYGIRHMYGLEGGRKNYSSVSCNQIQSVSNACSDGGCPFISFDDSALKNVLNRPLNSNDIKCIHEFRAQKQYVSACKYYLRTSFCNEMGDDLHRRYTPVVFYNNACKSS